MCQDLTFADVSVLKFGSSLLAGAEGFRIAADEIGARVEAGGRVVAVCSAQHGVTDALLGAAWAFGTSAPEALVARLLATGETASVALLALAVATRGIAVRTLDASGLGVRTRGRLLDAEPVELERSHLATCLGEAPVVVVPGFLGVDASGEPSVLGRGGSDLTALFLAHQLGAGECRLVKDVDGLFPVDPKIDPTARPFARATWEEALAVGDGLVQPKALHFARERGHSFVIAAPRGRGTVVGAPLEVGA